MYRKILTQLRRQAIKLRLFHVLMKFINTFSVKIFLLLDKELIHSLFNFIAQHLMQDAIFKATQKNVKACR